MPPFRRRYDHERQAVHGTGADQWGGDPGGDLEALARRALIAPGAELGQAVRKTQQKVQQLQRLEARASFQQKVAIGNVAEEVGLTSIPLSGLQLRGALLAIIAGAKDPAHLSAAGRAWLESRQPARAPGTFRVFVTAATIGAELTQACSEMRLRRVPMPMPMPMPMPKGFAGRLALAQALELGRLYGATVHVDHADEERRLVDRGEVDAELVGALTAEAGSDGGTVRIENRTATEIVPDMDCLVPIDGEIPAMTTSANDDAPTQREAAPSARPRGSIGSLRRPLTR